MKDRNLRQGFLGMNSEFVFTGTKVAIIGTCGGGSHIAQQLAHVGIGTYFLIDPDVVEDPNLNRMIGSTPADAVNGTAKTTTISRMIKAIRPMPR